MDTEVNLDVIKDYMSKFGSGEIFIGKEYWDEGIAIIYINNPKIVNGISGHMIVQFSNVITELESWKDGKGVIIKGKGLNFSSGGDLEFARNCQTPKDAFYFSTLMQDTLKRFRHLPFFTISLLHGLVLGGGAEIAVFADEIVAADDVKLGFVHGNMGIITAWGGTTRLVQILGEKRALDVLLRARIMNAEECLRIGLTCKIVSSEEHNMLDECLVYMREKTKHSPSIIRSFKKAAAFATDVLLSSSMSSFESSLEMEKELFCKTWGAEPHLNALSRHIKHVKKNC